MARKRLTQDLGIRLSLLDAVKVDRECQRDRG
jgi:hypothetical protein